jgi:hypothetical protein
MQSPAIVFLSSALLILLLLLIIIPTVIAASPPSPFSNKTVVRRSNEGTFGGLNPPWDHVALVAGLITGGTGLAALIWIPARAYLARKKQKDKKEIELQRLQFIQDLAVLESTEPARLAAFAALAQGGPLPEEGQETRPAKVSTISCTHVQYSEAFLSTKKH